MYSFVGGLDGSHCEIEFEFCHLPLRRRMLSAKCCISTAMFGPTFLSSDFNICTKDKKCTLDHSKLEIK